MSSTRMIHLLLLTSLIVVHLSHGEKLVQVLRAAPFEYTMSTHSCCNGVVNDKPWPNYDCCGNEFMNKDSEICCEDTIHNSSKHIFLSCCGNILYHVAEKDCQQSSAFVQGQYLTHYITVPKTVTQVYCGSNPINRSNQTCCGFEITDNPDGTLKACCGVTAYNTETHKCCAHYSDSGNTYDVVVAIPESDPDRIYQCCNLTIYDVDTHFCSFDEVITEKPAADSGKIECFGYIMDPETHLCCEPPVLKDEPHHNMCCGGKSYSSPEGTCCCNQKGDCQIHAIGAKCCGAEVMLPEEYELECCGEGEKYDPRKQTCCSPNGIQYEINEGADLDCCGMKAYDPNTNGCCGVTLVPLPVGGKSWCCKFAVEEVNSFFEERQAALLFP